MAPEPIPYSKGRGKIKAAPPIKTQNSSGAAAQTCGQQAGRGGRFKHGFSWRFATVVLAALVLSPLAFSAQTAFKKAYRGNSIQLAYQWPDYTRTTQNLQFTLNIDDVTQARREFQPFNNQEGNEEAYRAVKNYVKQFNTKGREVKLIRTYGGFDVAGTGFGAAEFATIQQNVVTTQKEAYDTYIHNKYYTYLEEGVIMPDHKRIAQRYVRAMAPVAAAIRAQTQGKTPREVINYTLSFLQSIPYDRLESRYTSNGAGFQTPYALLESNRGDCDTKAVALIAILRNLFPSVRLAMIYVPEHAFVGVGFQASGGDQVLSLGGNPFVLADPTGPSTLPIGKADPTVLVSLRSKNFSFQEVPF